MKLHDQSNQRRLHVALRQALVRDLRPVAQNLPLLLLRLEVLLQDLDRKIRIFQADREIQLPQRILRHANRLGEESLALQEQRQFLQFAGIDRWQQGVRHLEISRQHGRLVLQQRLIQPHREHVILDSVRQ